MLNQKNSETEQNLSEDLMDQIRIHQHFGYAIIGGIMLSLICAILWAVITVTTEYQIGYMAIGVGIIVGMGVRYLGAGIDPLYGYIGAILSLLGCLLGNLFSQVGFAAQAQGLGYFEVLTYLNWELIVAIFKDSFNPIDLLFYGIAVYEGYKIAFRKIPENISETTDFTPPLANFRLPFVVVSATLILLFVYNISKGISGDKTYYYESGSIMSQGELTNGKEEGMWNYYYETGELYVNGKYENGLEADEWLWYNTDSTLMKRGNYKHGLPDGIWVDYHPNGNPSDSTEYFEGRMHGKAISYSKEGFPTLKGYYNRDDLTGSWEIYFPAGQINMKGEYNESEKSGIWNYWYSNGQKMQELRFIDNNTVRIINAWDIKGRQIVKNGYGKYKNYSEDNTLLQEGLVEAEQREGTWKSYSMSGILLEEGIYEDDIYKIINSYSPEGVQLVQNGEGVHVSYYEDTNNILETGNINNGLKEGVWTSYYNEVEAVNTENNFQDGKLHGPYTIYYRNGLIRAEGNFEEDKKTGEWIWYYESGIIECTVNYIEDKKEGKQVFLSENGIECKEEIYENGELVSTSLL